MRNNYLLDADETILDFVRASKESLAEAMRELNIPYRDSDYAVYKRFNDAVWRRKGKRNIFRQNLPFGLSAGRCDGIFARAEKEG